jgi:F420-dependent oxidoreductase-like protein
MPLDLRLMLEPQEGAPYAKLLAAARAAEAAGYDGVFRSDHLLTIGGSPQPALEAWTTLAALARDTSRVRLGTLVTPMTFRHPAVLAREVATVDELSGGRLELGVGAGWFEPEHVSLGIPFPTLRERMDRLAESVEVMTLLWRGEPVDHRGEHLQLQGAHALPRPVQDPLPIIVGGGGRDRTIAVAVRFAAEYNTTSCDPKLAARVFSAVREGCESSGRDPATLRLSWMGSVVVAADEARLRRRTEHMKSWSGSVVATYDQAAELFAEYAQAGAQRIYARIWNLDDLDQISEIATEVMGRLS